MVLFVVMPSAVQKKGGVIVLRYGRKKHDLSKRICANCQHYCADIDPHSGWGICNVAKDGGLFRNHSNGRKWIATHTNGRYYTQTACKVRFVGVNEGGNV